MLILLRTQVDRTDKTPVTARHTRVGSLCRFLDAAEHVPTGHQKTGRCANVRECCGNSKRRRETACGRLSEEEGAASGEAGEKAWRFSAPARPLLPAVRAVSGDKNGAFLRLSKVE